MQYETKTHKVHTGKHKYIYAQWNGPSVTKPNPENCKNCSSKCAYDCDGELFAFTHCVKIFLCTILTLHANIRQRQLATSKVQWMEKHWRGCIAKQCVSPTKSQSMTQCAVTSLLLDVQWHYESMQQTEVLVQCIHQRCHIVVRVTDNIQYMVAALSQFAGHTHKNRHTTWLPMIHHRWQGLHVSRLP